MTVDSLSNVLKRLRQSFWKQARDRSDSDLLECFVRRQDESAFAALLQRHGPMVLGVCRRVVGNAHDAEDAFQATFLVLVRKAGSIARRELLSNWLYGVAYRTAREMKKRLARRHYREKQIEPLPEPPLESQNDEWEMAELLDRELSRLPEKYRVPVVLCDLQNHSRKEAATLLGIPEGTLSSRLATARRKLARQLARSHPALSASALGMLGTAQAAPAVVPPALSTATVQAAREILFGSAVASGLSPQVVAVCNKVLSILWWNKMKKSLLLFSALMAFGGLLSMLPFLVQGQSFPLPTEKKDIAQAVGQAAAQAKKEILRYDGKTFAEWQTILQTELKPERLIEAISAMEVFGINGLGKEAAQAMLQFSAHYKIIEGDKHKIFSKVNRALTKIGPEAETVLLDSLKSPNPKTRQLALDALAGSSPLPEQLPAAVFGLLKDQDPGVRSRAVGTLHKFQEKEGVLDALKAALKDKEPLVRDSAVSVLLYSSFPSETVLPLALPALWDPDSSFRYKMVDDLIRASHSPGFGGGPAMGMPGDEFMYDDPRRKHMGDAPMLKHLSTNKKLLASSLIQALEKVKDNQAYRENVIIALGIYGDQQAVGPLLDELGKTSSLKVKSTAIQALGNLGPDATDALPTLQGIVADLEQSPSMRSNATTAINRITGKTKGKAGGGFPGGAFPGGSGRFKN